MTLAATTDGPPLVQTENIFDLVDEQGDVVPLGGGSEVQLEAPQRVVELPFLGAFGCQ